MKVHNWFTNGVDSLRVSNHKKPIIDQVYLQAFLITRQLGDEEVRREVVKTENSVLNYY